MLSAIAHDMQQKDSYLVIKDSNRTFSRRNSQKKKRPGNKMAAPEASVHPVRNCLYHSFLYQTNESCSRIVSRRLMLIRNLNKSYLRVTAPNAKKAERPFY